jgi:hypothetical protein
MWNPPDPAGTMVRAEEVSGRVSAGQSPPAGLELRSGVLLAPGPSARPVHGPGVRPIARSPYPRDTQGMPPKRPHHCVSGRLPGH